MDLFSAVNDVTQSTSAILRIFLKKKQKNKQAKKTKKKKNSAAFSSTGFLIFLCIKGDWETGSAQKGESRSW